MHRHVLPYAVVHYMLYAICHVVGCSLVWSQNTYPINIMQPNLHHVRFDLSTVPIQMRSLILENVKIGSEFNAAGPINIYAADIPGLVQIGLGSVPAFILGMDVMGKHKLVIDIDENKLYLKKKSSSD